MPKPKQQLLDELKAKVEASDITPELRAGATQLVFGDGSVEADIVFIGEAPGKNEDEKGVPFIGAAGKFLNEMLEMIGMDRKDIYITNIVKYRPPNNRDPEPAEKAEWLPILQEQLDIIQPKLIVTLGRHSMDVLLPGLKISQVHGAPKRIRRNRLARVGRSGGDAMLGAGEQRTEPSKQDGEGVAEPATTQRAPSSGSAAGSAGSAADATWVILPLFHPAAALYNGGMRQTLIDDFATIPLILEKIKD